MPEAKSFNSTEATSVGVIESGSLISNDELDPLIAYQFYLQDQMIIQAA